MTDGIIHSGKEKFAVFVQKAAWSWRDGIRVVLEVDSVTYNWLRDKLRMNVQFGIEIGLRNTDGTHHKIIADVIVDRLPLKNSLYTEVYLSGDSWKAVKGKLEDVETAKEKVVFT